MPNIDPKIVWRVMLGAECLPIVFFMALLVTIPESPRWLVRAGRREEAKSVLERIGFPDVSKTLEEISSSLRDASHGQEVALFQRRYFKPILLAFLIAFFNQVSGINAINYYAPRIFQMIFGEGSELAALAGTIGVGCVNLTFTMLAFLFIDRFGRRALIIGGASMMILMHAIVAWQLSLPSPSAAIAVTGILGFIAFFAVSSGAVIWVYISEVFPNVVRAKGQALGCFTHWFMCTVISWAFPVVAERAGTWAFGFFAFMMLIQLLWAIFFMPETKGGTIEDIEKRLGISG
jgi:sugar porter (SP) family MFS transporter